MSFSLRELSDKSIESEKIKGSFGKAKKKYYALEQIETERKLTKEERAEKITAYIDMCQASNLHLSTYKSPLSI